MPIIIDGHNLLWAIQNPDEDTSITDVAMCQALDTYFGHYTRQSRNHLRRHRPARQNRIQQFK